MPFSAPAAPPARPHTAHPNMSLASSVFPRSVTPTLSASSAPRAASASFAHREAEWEDAWDSSSDREDDDRPPTHGARTGSRSPRASTSTSASTSTPTPIASTSRMPASAPIPIRQASDAASASAMAPAAAGSISASWASASFHHVTPPSRPTISASKTYAPGTAPAPGGVVAPPSRLPPGGAWEIVESADAEASEVPAPAKVGKEAIRDDVEDVLKDPLQLLRMLSHSAPPTPVREPSSLSFPTGSASPSTASLLAVSTSSEPRTPSRRDALARHRSQRTERRRDKFHKALCGRVDSGGGVDLGELRKVAWSGVPNEVRPIVWQLLLNYLPLPVQPRLATLQRKRKEYSQLVEQYFGRGPAALDQAIWHQIEIDVPRTRPGAPLWSCPTTQRALERILYVWAIRHPASGYVQGINDLATPFFEVFLSAYVDTDPELFDVGLLDPHVLAAIEADAFWCLTKLLDGIQDHYISQQPGIQRLVKRMGDLVKRIDAPLAAHFEEQGVEYMQFAFRWMNCLLMRELSVKCTIRMWDTYLSEGADAFSQFHLYVCSALLVKFSDRLREMDFQEMIIFLQNLPTHTWTDVDVELLLSEAYVLKMVWSGADNHFKDLKQAEGGWGMLGR
ncbi:GTPase-activating protein [Cryptotrichosporon argae]